MVLLIAIHDGELKKGSKIHCASVGPQVHLFDIHELEVGKDVR